MTTYLILGFLSGTHAMVGEFRDLAACQHFITQEETAESRDLREAGGMTLHCVEVEESQA